MRRLSKDSENGIVRVKEFIEKNQKSVEVNKFIKGVKENKDLSVNAEAEFGGPRVGLNIESRNYVINLLIDLRTRINISIFKRLNNDKKNKGCK